MEARKAGTDSGALMSSARMYPTRDSLTGRDVIGRTGVLVRILSVASGTDNIGNGDDRCRCVTRINLGSVGGYLSRQVDSIIMFSVHLSSVVSLPRVHVHVPGDD